MRGLINDGIDDGARQRGVADRQARTGREKAFDEFFVDALQHDEPRKGGAFLAGVAERAVKRGRNGLIEVGVIVDDQGILAAHFTDDFFEIQLAGENFTGGFIDVAADGARTGERNKIDLRVRDQMRAGVGPGAGEKVQRTSGHAGFHHDFHQ